LKNEMATLSKSISDVKTTGWERFAKIESRMEE
jgi:hypothetical protein